MAEPKGENWLPHFLVRAKMSQSRLAKAVDTDRQAINRLMARTRAVPKEWADRLAPHLDTTSVELQYGPGVTRAPDVEPGTARVGQARVAGQVAAGMWLAENFVDATAYDPIPVVLARYPTLDQIAYKVVGPSMDRVRIFDGDYVITVPYWEARTSPRDGDIVVVESRSGHLVERTCKQVLSHPDRLELWPRSSHEEYQKPLVVPRARLTTDDGVEVEIVGLVVGVHRPL